MLLSLAVFRRKNDTPLVQCEKQGRLAPQNLARRVFGLKLRPALRACPPQPGEEGLASIAIPHAGANETLGRHVGRPSRPSMGGGLVGRPTTNARPHS